MTPPAAPRVRPVFALAAGLVWRTVAAGWWASRAWYVARAAVITAVADRGR
ncbi:hypothetical protein [Actinomycetospora chibensis]|uniref:Uncharacterized protein n=1 Tax=Actinomycetospora chibensis TaxID=663606 RepID=A0ABV9RGD8_9PSEU|nr:hypothetical protein [Actinomycetospora chibensis]MDD7923787.1 hypothetical protein [Actinomycetospora chibensis]